MHVIVSRINATFDVVYHFLMQISVWISPLGIAIFAAPIFYMPSFFTHLNLFPIFLLNRFIFSLFWPVNKYSNFANSNRFRYSFYSCDKLMSQGELVRMWLKKVVCRLIAIQFKSKAVNSSICIAWGGFWNVVIRFLHRENRFVLIKLFQECRNVFFVVIMKSSIRCTESFYWDGDILADR